MMDALEQIQAENYISRLEKQNTQLMDIISRQQQLSVLKPIVICGVCHEKLIKQEPTSGTINKE